MNAAISESCPKITVEVKRRFFGLKGKKIIISRELKDKQSELKFRSLTEHIPDAFFSVDLQGNIVDVNKASEEITGYVKEELSRMNLLSFIYLEGYGGPIHVNELLNKKIMNKRAMITHKDGHRVWINMTCFPIVIKDKMVGLHAIAKDVSNLTFCLEEADMLQKMFNNTIDMIFLSELRRNGEIKIVNVNHYLCKKLGLSKNELSTMSYFDLYAKKKIHTERMLQKLMSEKRLKSRTSLLKKNGEKLDVDVYLCLFEHNGQKFIQTVARDILEFDNNYHDKMDRGTRLRVLMSKKNINTSELAEMTGLSIATISNLRTGKITKPHIGTAKLVADYLEVELSEIWSDL